MFKKKGGKGNVKTNCAQKGEVMRLKIQKNGMNTTVLIFSFRVKMLLQKG